MLPEKRAKDLLDQLEFDLGVQEGDLEDAWEIYEDEHIYPVDEIVKVERTKAKVNLLKYIISINEGEENNGIK